MSHESLPHNRSSHEQVSIEPRLMDIDPTTCIDCVGTSSKVGQVCTTADTAVLRQARYQPLHFHEIPCEDHIRLAILHRLLQSLAINNVPTSGNCTGGVGVIWGAQLLEANPGSHNAVHPHKPSALQRIKQCPENCPKVHDMEAELSSIFTQSFFNLSSIFPGSRNPKMDFEGGAHCARPATKIIRKWPVHNILPATLFRHPTWARSIVGFSSCFLIEGGLFILDAWMRFTNPAGGDFVSPPLVGDDEVGQLLTSRHRPPRVVLSERACLCPANTV